MPHFREISFGSPTYQSTLALREAVLRAPLGFTLSAADLDGEARQRHFVLADEAEVIACVVIRPEQAGRVTLRQMAVAPGARGRGVGASLVRHVEEILQAEGALEIVMSARQSAVPFYEKLGYRSVGEVYASLGIPHIRMEKRLARMESRL